MWTCPECGHRFVTANSWHSCSNYTLDDHFATAQPNIRAVFNRFVGEIEKCGPVTIIPQKTRIAIQARVRFSHGIVRKKWFNAALWLTRDIEHPLLMRTEEPWPGAFVHTFRLSHPEEIDEALITFVREAYEVGLQRHLKSDRNPT